MAYTVTGTIGPLSSIKALTLELITDVYGVEWFDPWMELGQGVVRYWFDCSTGYLQPEIPPPDYEFRQEPEYESKYLGLKTILGANYTPADPRDFANARIVGDASGAVWDIGRMDLVCYNAVSYGPPYDYSGQVAIYATPDGFDLLSVGFIPYLSGYIFSWAETEGGTATGFGNASTSEWVWNQARPIDQGYPNPYPQDNFIADETTRYVL